MKSIFTLLFALFFSCACFAQSAPVQKNEPVKNKDATLKKNNTSSIEKDRVYSSEEIMKMKMETNSDYGADGVFIKPDNTKKMNHTPAEPKKKEAEKKKQNKVEPK